MSQAIAAKASGNTQYPKMHTLWKKEMDPPNTCALKVTMAAPHQTITNTAAKTSEPDSFGAVRLSVIDKKRHTSRGPHKSPIYVVINYNRQP